MSTPQTCANCNTTGLPILPVRYAVVPGAVAAALPAGISGKRVTEVALAPSLYRYALRTLREGFVYLFYERGPRGRKYWEAYSVAQDGNLLKQVNAEAAQPMAELQCARQGHNAARTSYFCIEQPEKCGTVWIAFSEHKWSPETIKAYADDAGLRDARMQRVKPAIWIKDPRHTHAAKAVPEAIEQVIEYDPKFHPPSLAPGVPREISKSDGTHDTAALTLQTTRYPLSMRVAGAGLQAKSQSAEVHKLMLASGKRADKKSHAPMLLALWDAIGITHELNGFRNEAAGRLKQYGDERELEITALNAIDGVKQALAKRVEDQVDTMVRNVHAMPNHGEAARRNQIIMQHARDPAAFARAHYPLEERYKAGQIASAEYQAQRSALIRQHAKDSAAMEAQFATLAQERAKVAATQERNAARMKQEGAAEAWKKYEDKLDRDWLKKFRARYDALLGEADKLIDARSVELIKWLEAPLLIDTLEDYHRANIGDGVAFEDAVGEAIFGIGSSKAGAKKIEEWVKEAKASVKTNLLWRAIALNQQEGIDDIDAALTTALSQTTPLTVAAWNLTLTNLKNLQRLADTYKKAQTIYNTNTSAAGATGSSAFGTRLKPINTRGIDKIVLSAGDAIFRAFRIDKAGDFVSEKLIQHVFSLRAFVDPVDSLRLVAAQAKEQKLASADILRRINTAKAFLDLEVPRSQQAASLAEAWDKFKVGKDGPTGIKDARLAIVVLLIESGNFANMMAEAKGDGKARAMLAASAMSITAAALDVAAAPAKGLWGSEAVTYQKLKLFGGVLGGAASIVGAGVDLEGRAQEKEKGRYALANLYLAKAVSGGLGGALALATAFTYGAGVIQRMTGRAALAQSARVVGGAAGRLIGARILLMSVGAWITVITIGLQVLIWIFVPNALEDWCELCAFGPKDKRDKTWNADRQLKEFDKALQEVL